MFYLVTVIYNELIESLTVVKKEINNATLFFVDNSTKKEICMKNKLFCNEKGINYITMGGNKGLPMAYNRVISIIPKNEDNWIIICDQDTDFENNLLDKYEKTILLNPNKKIFCPVIRDIKGIMSPSKKMGKKYVHSKQKDFNKLIKNYSFINSCMCINSKIFNSVQYDENLFLDLVDFDFIATVRNILGNDLFYVIQDTEIFQNFSGVTNNSYNSDFIRFQIFVKDMRYYHYKWHKTLFYANLFLFLRAVKLSILHRNLSFISILKKGKSK